ncbi:MAG: Transcriptional regulatory protein sin3 [Candelina mexicana]|nr:MAG: Transcriptional regulatory protein sin3 [Candelina mexicana]
MSEELGMQYTIGPEPKDPQEADKWHKTHRGLVLTDEAYSQLAGDQDAQQRFRNLILQFQMDQGSTEQYQDNLAAIFAGNQTLTSKFSSFLEAPTDSEDDKAAANERLSELTGITPLKTISGRPTFEESAAFLEDVKDRFIGQPGIYDEFLHRINMRLRDEASGVDTYAGLVQMLKGEPDLLERFQHFWPRESAKV